MGPMVGGDPYRSAGLVVERSDALPNGEEGGLRAVGEAELAQEVADVPLDRALAGRQFSYDLRVAHAPGNEPEHRQVAWCKVRGRGAPRPGGAARCHEAPGQARGGLWLAA